MGYLDKDGLSYLWGKVKAALAGKQDIITAGDGLSKDGDTLSVDNPVRGIYTQAEFDALTEAQKAKGTYIVDDGTAGFCGEVYSTEERRIGTWIDGRPLYRKVVELDGIELAAGPTEIFVLEPSCSVKNLQAISLLDTGEIGYGSTFVSFSTGLTISYGAIPDITDCFVVGYANETIGGISVVLTIEYTKTTDPEVSA